MITFDKIQNAELLQGDYVFVFTHKDSLISIFPIINFRSLLHLSAIGFYGASGNILHDQMDELIIDQKSGSPITYLLDEIEDVIGMVSELELYKPNERICLYADADSLENAFAVKRHCDTQNGIR